ncbi:unnamed protein product [Callosobruchus maculatus]|uniref:Uncharacterized protein n=1 Tax=Callosobruchus maculatus TaxID=64391 RepID=A0A653DIW8_CALMS|nr:unnamed protein product [Callosobruchus maculatus]
MMVYQVSCQKLREPFLDKSTICSKAATSDNIELLEAIRFAIGGKNVQKTKNYTHTNTADRLSEVKKENRHRKRDEDLSDGEDTKLKNKN